MPGSTSPRRPEAVVGHYRALGHHFSVRTDAPSELLAAVLADLATPEPAGHEYVITQDGPEAFELRYDDEALGGKPRLGAIHHRLLIDLNRRAAESWSGPLVHACAVTIGGETALLVGPPGAGKSTLTATLLQRGATLVAEDVCALDGATLQVRSYHRPLGLAEHALQELGVWPPDSDCGCAKHLLSASMLGAASGASGPIRAILFVDHRRAGVEPVSPARAVTLLGERGSSPLDRPGALAGWAAVAAGAATAHLGTSELPAAAAAVEALLGEPPGATELLVEQVGGAEIAWIGQEAVAVADGSIHHLNTTAAAVLMLSTDGDRPEDIAKALGCEAPVVQDALDRLAEVGLVGA